mmetsp:Transcript_21342/g.42816  ORF Transcript_21342/g.42816 Transcript_21342/m.42816 type:complete len:253 (-) Transcript_21342:298-1056(-)
MSLFKTSISCPSLSEMPLSISLETYLRMVSENNHRMVLATHETELELIFSLREDRVTCLRVTEKRQRILPSVILYFSRESISLSHKPSANPSAFPLAWILGQDSCLKCHPTSSIFIFSSESCIRKTRRAMRHLSWFLVTWRCFRDRFVTLYQYALPSVEYPSISGMLICGSRETNVSNTKSASCCLELTASTVSDRVFWTANARLAFTTPASVSSSRPPSIRDLFSASSFAPFLPMLLSRLRVLSVGDISSS